MQNVSKKHFPPHFLCSKNGSISNCRSLPFQQLQFSCIFEHQLLLRQPLALPLPPPLEQTNKEAQHPKSIPPTRRLVISIFSYSRLVRLGFTEDLLIVLDNEFWFLISRNKMLVWSSPTSPQKWLQSYKSICEWKHISTLPTTCATCSASRSGHLSWSFSWKAASPPCSCFDTLSHFWY